MLFGPLFGGFLIEVLGFKFMFLYTGALLLLAFFCRPYLFARGIQPGAKTAA